MMNLQDALGFHWDSSAFADLNLAVADNPKKPVFMLKKMLAEYVWDIVHLEDNPYSFVEVQTLLDGETVGGYSLFDQTQVLNQEKAIKCLIEFLSASQSEWGVNRETVLRFHSLVAREEALKWGVFRDGEVGIGGTAHKPPRCTDLDSVFDQGFACIQSIEHPVERALVYYFWGAMNQFFYDGNKRTSRMVMNAILMANGFYFLSVPGAKKDEFNRVMVDFYNTKEASSGIRFMLGCYKNWD